MVYVDEAGVDNTENYSYGWCHKSQRFLAQKLGHKTEKISVIAGWSVLGLMAPMTFSGTCNKIIVENWVEQCLIP